ncbi:hypothetical protein T07_1635 [Trichinella nelsoni]|uniref:Uncharacterized protein n=1 Tax=Trichinella nelsoni TaxID=6336 RepID=A0A0V0S3F3_9BILA|nr:hypothetical protein T07_1635 [Trichinella nelsoni]
MEMLERDSTSGPVDRFFFSVVAVRKSVIFPRPFQAEQLVVINKMMQSISTAIPGNACQTAERLCAVSVLECAASDIRPIMEEAYRRSVM